MDNPRDGRLDGGVISNDIIIVFEAKVGLDALLTENRYRIQIPSYTKACKRIIDEFNSRFKSNKKLQTYLLVNGEETDLFPPNHPLCTSNTGNKAGRFYTNLDKHNIKFISSNALWSMMMRSLIKQKRLCCDILFDRIFDKRTLGLLTAWRVIVTDEGNYEVVSIPKKILTSSEQAFS